MIDKPPVWRRLVLVLGMAILAAATASRVFTARVAPEQATGAGNAWGYGGGPEQIRYSSLTQINRTNVTQLEVAWTYDTGEAGALQTQPVVVDGVLYGYTPTHKTFARAARRPARRSGRSTPGMRGSGPNRGVMYWASGADRARVRGGRQLHLRARCRERASRSRRSARTAASICARTSAAIRRRRACG